MAAVSYVDDIVAAPVDVLTPCALRALLSSYSIPKLRARIVAREWAESKPGKAAA